MTKYSDQLIPIHSSNRYPTLDGLRGIAILMVLSWDVASEMHPATGTTLRLFHKLAQLNWSGVDLFFVLSGFLIGGILIDNRLATNYFRAFYIRRACRVFPLYYLCLLGFAITNSFIHQPDSAWRWLFQNQGFASGIGMGEPNKIPLWSYVVYLQNWWMAATNTWGPGWLGISWSLAVEEQFYLLLPLAILWIEPKHIGAFSVSCILAAPLFRLITPGLGEYCLLPCRVDALMFGVLVAWLLRLERTIQFLDRHSRLMTLGLAVCIMFCAALWYRPQFMGLLNYSFLACFYAMTLVVSVMFPSHWLSRLCRWHWLGAIGRISYGIYLLHYGLMGSAHILIFRKAPMISNSLEAAVSIGAIVTATVAAYFSYYLFELKIVAFGHRFRYSKAP